MTPSDLPKFDPPHTMEQFQEALSRMPPGEKGLLLAGCAGRMASGIHAAMLTANGEAPESVARELQKMLGRTAEEIIHTLCMVCLDFGVQLQLHHKRFNPERS